MGKIWHLGQLFSARQQEKKREMPVLFVICLVDRATNKAKSRAKSNWQLGATRRENWPFFLVFSVNGAFNKPN